MQLTDVRTEPARVLLFGPRASVEISSPRSGVLRVRCAPSSSQTNFDHPALPPKRSFSAIAGEPPKPLSAQRARGTLSVSAEGARLDIDLGRFSFTFHDAEGRVLARCLGVSGDHRPAQPIDDYHARIELAAPPGEAYLGFGEKVGPLDKRGMHLVFWNTDAFPAQPHTDPLYVSIPFFIGLREGVAWGFFLDETWRSEVDIALADDTRIAWESRGPELDIYLFVGPHPAEVIGRYTALTGRPAMPPLWSLGAHQSRWSYQDEDAVRGVVRAYRAHDLPLDAVYLDIDAMDAYKAWTWDPARFPDPAALARELRAEGIKLVTIVDPSIKREQGYAVYEEARARDYLVRLDRGEPLVGEVWADPAVFPDLTRDEVQRWWGDRHAALVDAGLAGVWVDMNEPSCLSIHPSQGMTNATGARRPGHGEVEGKTLPYDARHGKKRHIEVHNVYGLGMAKAAFEGLWRSAPGQRPFVITRAGFAGVQRYAGVWTGDFGSHFTHLEASIPMLLGLGLSGVAYVGADTPGFDGRPNAELLVRWTQAGMVYPLMRNHAARGTRPKEPFRFGEAALGLARAALERRYRLLPTLYTLLREATETGLPMLRALVLLDPKDPEAIRAFDQVLVGDDLLVAPVLRPGQTKRMAYLPAGAWLVFSNLQSTGEVSPGGRYVIADAPLDVVPMWLRKGGAVALSAPRPHTTTANWDALTWHIHIASEVRARLYEDEGEGDGPSRTTELSGGLDGEVFRLERRARGALPLARGEETIRLYGLSPPRAVEGARSHCVIAVDGAVELKVAADWDHIEIRL